MADHSWDITLEIIRAAMDIGALLITTVVGLAWRSKASKQYVDTQFAELHEEVRDELGEFRTKIKDSISDAEHKIAVAEAAAQAYVRSAIETWMAADAANDELRLEPIREQIRGVRSLLESHNEHVDKSLDAIFRKLDR